MQQALKETYHSADGATDSVGLELTIEATSRLVNLQREEHMGDKKNIVTSKQQGKLVHFYEDLHPLDKDIKEKKKISVLSLWI